MHAAIDDRASNGVPNINTYSANRNGMDDGRGMDNCMAFLRRVKTHAEDKGVVICMEYLNSKVNHTAFYGCKEIGTNNQADLRAVSHSQRPERPRTGCQDGDLSGERRAEWSRCGHT